MSAQTILSGGDKYYAYSGNVQGDVSVPAQISLIFIPNTGLRDSYVQIMPFYGSLVSGTAIEALGIEIKLDDVIIVNSHNYQNPQSGIEEFKLFIPRQSKLQISSVNTSGNNSQTRGANLIGYYL